MRGETKREKDKRCASERAVALALIAQHGPLYCVELSQLMNCSIVKAISILRRLWRTGYVAREKRPSPSSGQGRLYYRLL